MASANPSYDLKLQELTSKVTELEELSAALRDLIKPGFDVTAFHTIYDPLKDAARQAHDIYHELLQTLGLQH